MRLAARRPPEARGLGRDGGRLLAATPGTINPRFGHDGQVTIRLQRPVETHVIAAARAPGAR